MTGTDPSFPAKNRSTMSIDANARKVQVEAMFDRLAPEYQAVVPASFACFGRPSVEEAAVGYGERALDVACGGGAVLFPPPNSCRLPTKWLVLTSPRK
jgi:ubiquinone/menaquinone biosynthesis C-methylase UbiE